MTDDIVTWLRRISEIAGSGPHAENLNEAADEIERLRAQLEQAPAPSAINPDDPKAGLGPYTEFKG